MARTIFSAVLFSMSDVDDVIAEKEAAAIRLQSSFRRFLDKRTVFNQNVPGGDEDRLARLFLDFENKFPRRARVADMTSVG